MSASSPSSQKNVTAARHKLATITEQQFTNSLLEWAKAYGWRRFHVRNSGAHGVSQVQGDKGFPDLVLVGTGSKAHRIIFAELKVGKNKPSPEQDRWLGLLGGRDCVECYLWRPDEWTAILALLK